MNGGTLSAPSLPTGPTPSGSIPESSLLPTPAAGNVSAQISQGEQLLTQVKTLFDNPGDPAAQQALLKAGTTVASNLSAGLPRTLVTDALGIATGFAVGGPVGGIAAVAGVAVQLFTSLFSGGSPPVYEGIQSQPSQADMHLWTLLQDYMYQVTGGTESGFPPGWYLSLYMNRTRPPWSTKHAAEMLSLAQGTYKTPGGDPYAVQLMGEYGGNTNDSGGPPPSNFLAINNAAAYASTVFPAPPVWFYAWANPSGQGLTGQLAQGFSFTYGEGIQIPFTGNPPSNDATNLEGAVSPSSLWQSVLDDAPSHPKMSAAAISKNALALMPDPLWWDQDLYAWTFTDNSGNFGDYFFNTGLMNAMATVLAMGAQGAHPRAITSELLMQAQTIRQFGGPGGTKGTLTAAHQKFLDEWLDARKTTARKTTGAKAPTKTVRKTTASPLRAKTTKPKLLAPIKAPSPVSSPFLSTSFLYPAAGVGGALALYAGYRYLRDR